MRVGRTEPNGCQKIFALFQSNFWTERKLSVSVGNKFYRERVHSVLLRTYETNIGILFQHPTCNLLHDNYLNTLFIIAIINWSIVLHKYVKEKSTLYRHKSRQLSVKKFLLPLCVIIHYSHAHIFFCTTREFIISQTSVIYSVSCISVSIIAGKCYGNDW